MTRDEYKSNSKVDGQINLGWGLTFEAAGKQPVIANRIFKTKEGMEAYANDVNGTALAGLVLKVTTDASVENNGVYFVAAAGTADASAVLVKLATVEDTPTGKVNSSSYADVLELATSDNVGQLIYVEGNSWQVVNGDDITYYSTEAEAQEAAEGIEGATVEAGPAAGAYIVTGEGSLQKLAQTSASGDYGTDIAALQTRVGAVETKNGQQDTSIEDLSTAIDSLSETVTNLDNAMTDFNASLGDLEDIFTDYDGHLATLDASAAKADASIADMYDDFKELYSNLGSFTGNAQAIVTGVKIDKVDDASVQTGHLREYVLDCCTGAGDGGQIISIPKLTCASTAGSGDIAMVYSFEYDGTTIASINIPKDQFLKNASFLASATADDVSTAVNTYGQTIVEGHKYLVFEWQLDTNSAASGDQTVTYVDVNDLVDTYVGDGTYITVSDGTITLDVDAVANAIKDTINADVETRLDTVEASVSEHATAIETLESSVGTLESSVSALETSVGDHETRLGTTESSVGDLETSVGTLETSVGTLETSVGALETSVGTLETSVGELETSVGALETSVGALETSVAENASAIETLESSVGALESSVAENTSAIETIESDLSAMGAEVSTNTNNISALGNRVTTVEGKNNDLESSIGELNTAINELTTTVEAVSNKADDNADAIADVSSRLDASINEVKDYVGKIPSDASFGKDNVVEYVKAYVDSEVASSGVFWQEIESTLD